jgi:hypothetical protein
MPASITTRPSSDSTTVMFFPTSPSPPSGMIRVDAEGIGEVYPGGPGSYARDAANHPLW